MKKDKKVSFRYFLNKRLKPKKSLVAKKGKIYPLYLQITFDRKNTQIKCQWEGVKIYWSDEDLKEFESGKYVHQDIKAIGEYLRQAELVIEDIIKWEDSKSTDFSFKRFQNKLDFYFTPISLFISGTLKAEFIQDIELLLIAKQFNEIVKYDTDALKMLSEFDKNIEQLPKDVLSERTNTFFELYINYLAFKDLLKEHFDKAYGWLLGDTKKQFKEFLESWPNYAEDVYQNYHLGSALKTFPPIQGKIKKYLQMIDIEIIRTKEAFKL